MHFKQVGGEAEITRPVYGDIGQAVRGGKLCESHAQPDAHVGRHEKLVVDSAHRLESVRRYGLGLQIAVVIGNAAHEADLMVHLRAGAERKEGNKEQ